jgi:hypothetical protein
MFMTMLIALLLFGLVMAMVGFWRIGASYSTQRGAQWGAVNPSNGASVQNSSFQGWTNTTAEGGKFTVIPSQRSSEAQLNTYVIFDYMGFGPWRFSVDAQTHSRSERFYPGGPICTVNGCDE